MSIITFDPLPANGFVSALVSAVRHIRGLGIEVRSGDIYVGSCDRYGGPGREVAKNSRNYMLLVSRIEGGQFSFTSKVLCHTKGRSFEWAAWNDKQDRSLDDLKEEIRAGHLVLVQRGPVN
jgi:hypothetical protein